MRGEDAEYIRSLSATAFAEYSKDPADSTLWMAEHGTTFVALRGGVRVGFLAIDLTRQPTPEVSAVAVNPGARGRRIGQELLGIGEDATRRAGYKALVAHTADANLAALALFLRCGFRIQRRLNRYYLNMYDACELVKHW